MTPEAEAWLRDGRATRLPRELSEGFDEYINTLPWGGSRIDLMRVGPVERLDLDQASDADVAAWLARTHLGSHSHLAIWYSREKGGVVVALRDAIGHIDDFYVSPDARYAFAVDVREGEIVPAFEDLVEYRYGTFIALSAHPQWPRVNEHTAPARVHWTQPPPSGAEYVGVTRFDDPRRGHGASWFQVVLRFFGSRDKVEVGVLSPELPQHVLAPGFAFELCHGECKVADVTIDGRPSERPMTSWVWVFMTAKGKGPSGIFTELGPAHRWARENRLTGTLTRYPLDKGTPAFPTADQESFDYQDGVCFNLDG